MMLALRSPEVSSPDLVPDSTQRIGRAAVAALYDELSLEPKPGLVSFRDSGSHRDMDAAMFLRSLCTLKAYFPEMAFLGRDASDWSALEHCGKQAERRMMDTTGGINTHRGAVFMLGILCASAGHVAGGGHTLTACGIRQAVIKQWGVALKARAHRPTLLPGGIAARAMGLRGASQEAAEGFPVLFDVAVPAMRDALRKGLPPRHARLLCLLAVMSVLDDCNVAHRGGIEALRHVRRRARSLLAAEPGPEGLVEGMRLMHRDFVARSLSPGGAADTLAAACWIERVCAS